MFHIRGGRGDPVERPRLRSRRAPGSKLDSIEYQPCMWACFVPNHTQWRYALPPVWCGSLERGYQPRHRLPTTAPNNEASPKTALVLLQVETLILSRSN
ncbi:hypothetical protein AVEN_201766-1 [Araneus ventricosus]|uniref:Uncharacterized protein n=1 Tax=Araneus ventricosus TaxID=182803 RepID=A0A4Y2J2K8_ARAVE|nr:hypothetical protein AVEN_201766-1 [Araneus ventricosus]